MSRVVLAALPAMRMHLGMLSPEKRAVMPAVRAMLRAAERPSRRPMRLRRFMPVTFGDHRPCPATIWVDVVLRRWSGEVSSVGVQWASWTVGSGRG